MCMLLGQEGQWKSKDKQGKARGKAWELGKVIDGRNFELSAPFLSSLLASALKAATAFFLFFGGG